MNRREFLKYSAATAGLAAVAQVTGSPLASASPRPASSSTSASLSLLLDHTSLEVTRFQHIVSQFEKANPGITVSVENIADAAAFYTKVNTDGVGHTLPDVWYVRTFDVSYDALKGWTEPLDPYIAKTPGFNVDDFFPALRGQMSYNGKTYTLPWNLSDMLVFVNKTIFQKAGVAIPSPDWDWDGFASTASKLSAKMSGQHYAGDITNLLQDGYWVIEGVLEGNGGSLLSPDFKHSTTTAAPNVDLLNFFVGLHAKGYMPTPGAFPAGVDPFVAGLEAMAVNGSWVIGTYPAEIARTFEWEILPLPKGSTGKRGVSLAGGGFGVASTSHNKEAAFMLADWLTNTASLNYVVSGFLDSLPARQSSMPEFLKTASNVRYAPGGMPNVLAESKAAIPTTYPPYVIPLDTALTNRMPPIFTGSSVKNQLSALGGDIDTMINDYYG
jgi:multiple sugar transport system substrate-binding protein